MRFYDYMATTPIGNAIIGEGNVDACGYSVILVIPDEAMLRMAIGSVFNDPRSGRSNAGHGRVYDIAAGADSTWDLVGTEMNGENGVSLDYRNRLFHIGEPFGFSLALSSKGERVAIGSLYYSDERMSDYYYGAVKLYGYDESVSD